MEPWTTNSHYWVRTLKQISFSICILTDIFMPRKYLGPHFNLTKNFYLISGRPAWGTHTTPSQKVLKTSLSDIPNKLFLPETSEPDKSVQTNIWSVLYLLGSAGITERTMNITTYFIAKHSSSPNLTKLDWVGLIFRKFNTPPTHPPPHTHPRKFILPSISMLSSLFVGMSMI